MFKHILLPIDGSQLSEEAAERAAVFARETQARITAFFVREEYPAAWYGEAALVDPSSPADFNDATETQARKHLARIAEICQRVDVECNTLSEISGTVYQAVIDAANENGCDLIFMASHGRRGLSGFLLGSETHKVLTHSKIPVLVYR